MPGLMPLLVLLLLFTVGVAIVMLLVVRFSVELTHRFIGHQFAEAEYLVQNRRPPPSWTKPRNSLQSLMPHGTGESEKARRKTKLRIHDKLDRMIRYFENSPYFDSEETRAVFLQELRQIQERWNRSSLDEILAGTT